MNQYERSSYAVHGILASIMQLTPIDQATFPTMKNIFVFEYNREDSFA